MGTVVTQYGRWQPFSYRPSEGQVQRSILIEFQSVNDAVTRNWCCPKAGKACWRAGIKLGSGLAKTGPEGDFE